MDTDNDLVTDSDLDTDLVTDTDLDTDTNFDTDLVTDLDTETDLDTGDLRKEPALHLGLVLYECLLHIQLSGSPIIGRNTLGSCLTQTGHWFGH